MNTQSITHPLITVIKWLAILTMATPLIVSSSTLFPYVFGKAIAFQLLVEIMAVIYVWLLFTNYRETGRFNYLPRLNYLTWSVMIFFIILLLSTIFSVDPSYSFWSKQERMDGLFNLTHFLVFFLVLTATINKKQLLQILDASLIISFITCLYALGQLAGKIFLPYGERLTSTLGNSAFLAAYLIFNIFFALILLASRKNIWAKIWYIFLGLFGITILLLTYTRGAIIGFAAGLIIFSALFFFFSKKNKYKKYILGLLILIIAMASALFLARNTNFVQKNHLFYRLTDLSLEKGTGKTRIISWKIGFNAFFDRPLLGWGQENYYIAFNKHIDPVFFTYSQEVFDRAHNKIIDLLVMNGFLGLVAYLAIFTAAFLRLWKIRKKLFVTSLLAISLLAAYFLQNLLIFDTPVSYLMFFLLLSLISIISRNDSGNNKVFLKTKRPIEKAWPALFAWGTTILIIFLAWAGNIKPLIASHSSVKGERYLSAKEQDDETLKSALAIFKSSLNNNSFTNHETKKVLSQFILSAAANPTYSSQAKISALNFTAAQLEQETKEMPYFFDTQIYLIAIYNTLAYSDNSNLAKGGETGIKIIEKYPNVPSFYYKFIVNRIMAGDYQKAIAAGQKAVQLNPGLEASNWNLGLAYFYAGDFERAKTSMEKSIELGYSYNNANSLFQLARLYFSLKDNGKAISFYKKALDLNPSEPEIEFELAKTYKEAGQTGAALELAQKVLASSTPQTATTVQGFIDSLK